MRIPVEELRAKAVKFQRRIRWRNLRELVAALIVIVLFGWNYWWTPHTVPRILFAWIIVWAIYYAWHLRRWGTPRSLPADMGRADCVRFYQSELQRQRDLICSIWKWAIGPVMLPLALLFAYQIVLAPPRDRWFRVVFCGVYAAFVWVIYWLNLRAARRLDGRIKELDCELGSI